MATRQKTVRKILTGATRVTQSDMTFDSVQVYDATGVTWYDETTDAGSSTTGDVALYGAVDSAIYFGDADKFYGWHTTYSTAPSGGVSAVEYWNGSTWAAINQSTDGYFSSTPTIANATFKEMSGWSTTTVNGVANLYWVRIRVSSVRTTAGVLSTATCIKRRTISKTIELDSATGRTFVNVTARLLMTSVLGGVTQAVQQEFQKSVAGSSNVITYAGFGTTVANTTNVRGSMTGTLEQSAFSQCLDYTSLFTDNFSGTSHTVTLGFTDYPCNAQVGDQYWYSAELLVTYNYDDTQSTPMKTVMIPLESEITTISTSLQTIDSITKLTGSGGFIEEASPTIKDAYFIIFSNRRESSTSNTSVMLALNSESETEFALNMANQSPYGGWSIFWDRSADIPTTTQIDFKARVTQTNLYMDSLSPILIVTYTYDNASTTRENMSVWVPIGINTINKVSSASDAAVFNCNFWIPESNPTLKESALSWFINTGYLTINSNSSYTAATNLSWHSVRMRIGSGSALATGQTFSLATGKNTLKIHTYINTNTNTVYDSRGVFFLILNYSYDKSSTYKSRFVLAGMNKTDEDSAFNGVPYSYSLSSAHDLSHKLYAVKNKAAFDLPESVYFINAFGFSGLFSSNVSNTSIQGRVTVHKTTAPYDMVSSSEDMLFAAALGYLGTTTEINIPITKNLALSTQDVSTCLFPETSYHWLFFAGTSGTQTTGVAGFFCILAHLWYFDPPYTISGTVSGYTGDGSGIAVKLHSHQYGGRVVAETTTTTGGNYTFKWHDNTTDDLFVETDAGTKVGRSQNFTAS